MAEEFPCGFIAFSSHFEFAQACSFCADFSFDVLEVYVDGKDYLCFFSVAEFTACSFLLFKCILFPKYVLA